MSLNCSPQRTIILFFRAEYRPIRTFSLARNIQNDLTIACRSFPAEKVGYNFDKCSTTNNYRYKFNVKSAYV